MAITQSGASTDLWTIDPTSKAGRVTLYGPNGDPLVHDGLGYYASTINIRQTAATAANTVVWALRNTSATRVISIERIDLQLFFDGTTAATTMKYEFGKYTGATGQNGTAVTSLIKRTSQGAPVAASTTQLDTGITLTAGTLQALFYYQACSRTAAAATAVGATVVDIVDLTGIQAKPIELVQNEAFVIRTSVTAVIGDNIIGEIGFTER